LNKSEKATVSDCSLLCFVFIKCPDLSPVREEPPPPVIFLDSRHNFIACKIAYNFHYNERIASLFFKQVTNFLQENNLITGRRRSGRSNFFFLLQTVHGFNHQENTEGDDQKVNNVLNKHSVID